MLKCLLHQTAREFTLLLDNNLHEKKITVGQGRRNFETVGTVCNFHSCYKFVLVLHENAIVLSLQKPVIFSMYVSIKQKKSVRETAEKCF